MIDLILNNALELHPRGVGGQRSYKLSIKVTEIKL